ASERRPATNSWTRIRPCRDDISSPAMSVPPPSPQPSALRLPRDRFPDAPPSLGDAPRDATSLARECGVDADMLHRTMRALASSAVFAACVDGRERGLEEFRSLLERGGFSLRRHWTYPTIAVMEAVAP